MHKLANISQFESIGVHNGRSLHGVNNGLFRSASPVQFRLEANNLFQKLKIIDELTYAAMTSLVGMLRTQSAAGRAYDTQTTFHLKWIQNKMEKLRGGLDDALNAYNGMVAVYKKGR